MPTSSNGGRRSRGRTGARYLNNRKRLQRSSRICWICNELIPEGPEYVWPHPLSFSADHVTPDSEIEDFDDEQHYSLDNLRSSHLVCNQRRGTGKAPASAHPQSRDWLADE